MTRDVERLKVSRLIKAEQDRVFSAWTDPAMILQWWGAGGVRCTAAEMNLIVGGTYRIANQAPDGKTMWITGIFSQVNPPQDLTYTWTMEPITDDSAYSLVEVTFDKAAKGTLVTIVQTKIASPEAREIHLQGWVGCLEGLNNFLNA
jgi:uncharacterized protein YndB with AHSA1/START domain